MKSMIVTAVVEGGELNAHLTGRDQAKGANAPD